MIKILKGDTSADISFALADGFDYSGATVHVEYQGAVKTFTGCAAGDVLAFRFSADETAVMSLGSYPVVVRITNPSGIVKTIQNANTKICVTDDPAEVSGGAIALDVRGMLYGIEDLPERWTEADLVAKLREIMRRGGAVLCTLLTFSAFGASVQTARKDAVYNDAQIVTNVTFDGLLTEHQDISGKADRTNTYTKAETDARIGELAPPTSLAPATNYTDHATNEVLQSALRAAITTNDVRNIVTNAVVTFGEWVFVGYTPQINDVPVMQWTGSQWEPCSTNPISGGVASSLGASKGDAYSTALEWTAGVDAGSSFSATRKIFTRNALGLARLEDVPDTSNFATAAALAAESNRVNTVAGNVNILWTHVYGNSVWIAVTNYMRTIEGVVPSFQLWEVRGGVTNCVYSSAEEIENTVTQKVNAAEERIRAAIPTNAWSAYQSATGAPNPQPGSITIVSTPAIQMTGGGEWFNYVATGGRSIWVLQSNGLTTFGGGTNGFFRVRDDEGRTQMEVINTQDQWIDAIPADTGWDNGNFVVTYNWTNSVPPTLYAAADLSDPGIGEENGEINALGISVTWAQGAGGYWAATVLQDEMHQHLFVYAKVKQPGIKAVVNRSPTMMEGGIMYNGTQYRLGTATIDGKTVLTLETW